MKLLKKSGKESFWTAAVLAVLILNLIPLYLISLYNYPLADDFAYGAAVTDAVRSGGSLFYVLKTIILQVADKYRTWQGSYAAALFSALNPFVFNFSFRIVSAMILLSVFVFSVFYFFLGIAGSKGSAPDTGSRDKQDQGARRTSIITASVMCIACVNFCPRILDAFYWWNGAVNYELFLCLMLMILGILVRLRSSQHPAAGMIIVCILGVLCSGGNYVASLPYILCMAFVTIVCSVSNRKLAFRELIVFMLSLAGFIASVTAPGNAARMDTYNGTAYYSLKDVIYYSVQYAYYSVRDYLTPAILLLAFFPLPFMARHSCSESLKKIPSVILLGGMTFLFIVSYAPTVYVEGNGGAARAEDYRFFLFIFFLYLFEWNLVSRLAPEDPQNRIADEAADDPAILSGKQTASLGLICLCLFLTAAWYMLPAANRSKLNSIGAAYWIMTGAAQEYDSEMGARFDLLAQSDEKDIIIQPIASRVPLLYSNTLDAADHDDYFANRHLAGYFHKDSVVMASEEDVE